jgi:hypothetical protein
MTKKMQQCRIIYCFLAALHVSSNIFGHHQEHLNCIYSLWYYTHELLLAGFMGEFQLFLKLMGELKISHETGRQQLNVYNTRGCKYSLDAPYDDRKYCSQLVELPRNNKLSYTVASCWSFSYIIS